MADPVSERLTADTPWTQFNDMHSGGGMKEPPYEHIFIQAPEAEAKVIFYNRFGHNPDRVTCTCCGNDYSIHEASTLARATAFERGCKALETPRGEDGRYQAPDDPWWHEHYYLEAGEEAEAFERGWTLSDFPSFKSYVTVERYTAKPDVLVIPAAEIKPQERVGVVPEEGYVWVGN